MALVLTLSQGSIVSVGDGPDSTLFTVHTVHSLSDFEVDCGGKLFSISEDEWTTIAKGVKLRAPFPKQGGRQSGVRVQVEAPDHYVRRLN